MTDVLATPRYARIYAVIRRVPRGRVCTYGEVARAAGTGGPRQVGFALRHSFNQRLPWHRILNAAGVIRAPGESGVRQRALLTAEGVEFSARGRIDLKRFGWVAPAAGVPAARTPAARARGQSTRRRVR
jgi:methylated-DNA-protein-cysteine methyltransferase related protein